MVYGLWAYSTWFKVHGFRVQVQASSLFSSFWSFFDSLVSKYTMRSRNTVMLVSPPPSPPPPLSVCP